MESPNDICVKSSMAPQAYEFVRTHAHEISGWNFLSRPLHACAAHVGGINSYVQSDLATLTYNNGQNLKVFIAELSSFNNKSTSLDKLYLLQELSSIKLRHFQRAMNSRPSLCPRLQILLNSLTTTENWLYIQGNIFMDCIVN